MSSLVTATSRQRRINKKIKNQLCSNATACIRKLLRVEEALFRHSQEDWVIINDGVEQEAIVLGISGKPEELVHELKAQQLRVPLVKRFTGGGTVVVDKNTQFVSFIFNEGTVARVRVVSKENHGVVGNLLRESGSRNVFFTDWKKNLRSHAATKILVCERTITCSARRSLEGTRNP